MAAQTWTDPQVGQSWAERLSDRALADAWAQRLSNDVLAHKLARAVREPCQSTIDRDALMWEAAFRLSLIWSQMEPQHRP